MSRAVCILCLVCCLLLWFVLPNGAAQTQRPNSKSNHPNIVLILADDLGWADLSCYGADLHETPNLDKLAAQGVRFTQAYSAAPVCSPTRSALMTGKHPARLQITIWSEGSLEPPRPNRRLIQAPSRHSLPHEEITLAERLKEAGYLTALVGKWHLGDAQHYPETQGFDINIGGTLWGAPNTFFWPFGGNANFREPRYVPHLEFGKPGDYLTDRLTDEALRVIDHAGKQPFFLFLSHHAPHTPIEAKSADIEYFNRKLKPGANHQNAIYAAMIKSLDESVGRVIAHLKQRNLLDNTLIVFTSDNGGYIGSNRGRTVTNNAPLRSGKGSLYEGGLRIPLIVWQPGVTPKGKTSNEMVVTNDLFYTLLASAGLSLLQPDTGEGMNLWPLLKDPQTRLQRDRLFFHYPHYYDTTTPVSAIRQGEWKLLEYLEDQRIELFNLKGDPGETTDLSKQMPAQAEKLRAELHQWRTRVNAQMPKPNPDFKPAP